MDNAAFQEKKILYKIAKKKKILADIYSCGGFNTPTLASGLLILAREPVKNMERSGIFFTINHPLCGCETKAYSKKLSSKAIQ